MRACRYERYDWFPYNNGVMLWNMPYMKKTNAAFVDWILNQHNGLYYGRKHGQGALPASAVIIQRESQSYACHLWPANMVSAVAALPAGYTAVDQGAFNQYYEQEVKGKPISRVS